MADSVPAGVVLAAGAGERLRPLTRLLPKPLCPVGNVALVDLALERVAPAVGGPGDVAVNVHHHRDLMEAHLARRPGVHVSIEEAEALGTAGALGALRPWLDGRGALVVNADGWSTVELGDFVAGWDGERVRMLVHGPGPFGPRSPVLACLLPWSEIRSMEAVPSGLYEVSWRRAAAEGRLETVSSDAPFVDCGTPARYLEANLRAVALADGADGPNGVLVADDGLVAADGAAEATVVGSGAVVHGTVRRSVLWPGVEVAPGEVLESAIRADGVTVLVR